MPGIPAIYNPLDKTTNESGDKELVQRAALIKAYWRYYDGEHSDPLTVEPGKRNDNIIINLCGRAADKSTEFIGTPARMEIPGAIEKEPGLDGRLAEVLTPEQEALDLAYDGLRMTLPEIILSGLVVGHTFLKLYFDNDTPSVTLLDPQLWLIYWDVTNPARTLFYRSQWKHGDTTYRQDIVPNWLLYQIGRPDTMTIDSGDGTTTVRGEGWTIIDYVQKANWSTKWQETIRESWDYNFPPIVDWASKRRPHQKYGISLLKEATLNDGLNFIVSNTGRIIKFHAHPRTIAEGLTADQIEPTSVDGLFTVPEGAKVYNLEMQSDLASSMNLYSELKSEFFAGTRVIDLSTVKDKLGQITNFGVRMMFSDQVSATEQVRDIIGKGLGEMFRRLLILQGGAELESAPEARWIDPLPVNRLEQLSAAKIESELGVASKQMIAEDLGRDYAKVQEQLDEETSNGTDTLINVLDGLNRGGVSPINNPIRN